MTSQALSPDQLDILVLCGGQGTRLGGDDKPLLSVGNARLVDYVFESLPQARRTLVSANRNLATYGQLPCDLVTDIEPGIGPLAGLLSARERLSAKYVYVVPGDTPLLPKNLAAELFSAAQRNQQAAAVCRVGEQAHYLPMLVRRTALSTLDTYLSSSARSVKGWLKVIGYAEHQRPATELGLTNVNTAADLAALHSLLNNQ